MLCAVIGNGPRTGTSFVMGKLHEAGLPVVWDNTLDIPGADYDMLPQDALLVKDGIIKIWPPILPYVQLRRAVILRRNTMDQVRSIKQQKQREEEAGAIIDMLDLSPETILEAHSAALFDWLLNKHVHQTEILEVNTEDLNNRINEIVYWMSVPYLRRAS